MAENEQLKCSLCGAPAPTNAEGDHLPHLQIPLEAGKAGGERLLIRFMNPRVRCLRCKLQAVLAGVALCAAGMGEEGYDVLWACRSEIQDLRR
ncbi:MAG: hypothetical protein PHU85_16975 [Phycisphaerae bacterium]|jgi:hypothetical protein|nr:hypothetical protein [Phycisphaerae bacterium]